MNPTVANIVEQARMGYLALRTGDYRDMRRAVDHLTAIPSGSWRGSPCMTWCPRKLTPHSSLCACTGTRFSPPRRAGWELEDVLTEATLGH